MSKFIHAGEADRYGGWHWREPRRGDFFRTCSYCGSINPDDLVTLEGWQPDWADRKYGWPHKVYIGNLANPNPGLEFCIQAGPSPAPADREDTRFKLVADLTSEESEICRLDGMGFSGSKMDGYVGFGKRKTLPAKLYTIHLADDAIPEETKERIGTKIGLRFEFTDDVRIRWWKP